MALRLQPQPWLDVRHAVRKESTLADLIAITYETRQQANASREALAELAREHLIELEDTAIAYKDASGHVRLDQTVNLTASGAANGGFWGLLLGLVFSVPTGGAALFPLLTTAFGAGVGALSARLNDFGINEQMMKKLGEEVEAGKATLFVLARKVSYDKVVKHLGKFEGKVLRTSLPEDIEVQLEKALKHGAGSDSAQPPEPPHPL